MTEADWMCQAELADLLRACRARMAGPAVPGSRRGGLRQEDVADLAGLSLRRYAAFERGEFAPPAGMVDKVAAVLQMTEAERSALHVLASGQDPPRPVTRLVQESAGEPSKPLRDLVMHMGRYPAALTDETWTLLHYNDAMNAWADGWYDDANPADRNLVSYLFSKNAEDCLPDVHAVRRDRVAMLRYQYTRNLSPRFRGIVGRLTAASAEAADLWARHEVAFASHEYPVRLRSDRGIIDAHVLFAPLNPRLWSYVMVLPPEANTP